MWAAAEELDRGDICLDALDERYRGVGLRRYRRVFLARLAGRDEPVGMAIAYRGPLGLNFSFLENRCDLVLDPALGETEYGAAVRSLVHAAASIYADFELPFLLLTTDDRASGVLVGGGGTVVQRYSRCIWLRSGFAAWYRHVDGFYTKVMALQERKAERAARNAPDTSGPPS